MVEDVDISVDVPSLLVSLKTSNLLEQNDKAFLSVHCCANIIDGIINGLDDLS